MASTSGQRSWSTSTPCAAANRRTSRIWFSVSTGKSAPGTKIATAAIAFWRENFSISASLNGSRTTGSLAASPVPGLSESRATARAISSTGKPAPGEHMTTSVARTYGIS